jgi:putative oxidoreductase
MSRLADRLEPLAYTALRVVAGLMFAFHGSQKLFGFPLDKAGPERFTQAWFGGVIELVTGVLMVLGLFTRAGAFLASGTMAVAYFQFHFKGDFAGWHWLPMVNKGELAALYAFVFLYIALRGPGRLSVDGRNA